MHPQYTPEQIAHFWARVDKSAGHDGCWPWLKGRHGAGYGILRIANQAWLAHRLSWTLTCGPIPRGLSVLHRCDNPPCCNPHHLWLGTNADNNADRDAKGRAACRISPEDPRARLTPEQVRDIRQRYAVGRISQRALAREYEVDHGIIRDILSYRIWRHIAPEFVSAVPYAARLTHAQTRAIRLLCASGVDPTLLAQACGLSLAALDRLVRRKLTAEQVRAIRQRYAAGGISQQTLAQDYGVAPSLIWAILKRKTWKDLDDAS